MITVVLRLEEVGVTLATSEHAGMDAVAEHYLADSPALDRHISDVAGNAVAGYVERRTAVVTGAAGPALGHRLHRGVIAVFLRLEEVGVALVTTEHAGMDAVTEYNLAEGTGLDCNVPGMASGAITGDTERPAAIVACAAGHSPLHHFHADMIAVSLLFEDLRVTKCAVGTMAAMTENNFADPLGLDGDFVRH
jgi:hypothetical protein